MAPLLKARGAVGQQIADLDRQVMRLAHDDAQVRRFMTALGGGPIRALCRLATIDDSTRFRKSNPELKNKIRCKAAVRLKPQAIARSRPVTPYPLHAMAA